MSARIASVCLVPTVALTLVLATFLATLGGLRAGDEPKKDPVKPPTAEPTKGPAKEPAKDAKADKLELVIPGQILDNDPVDKVRNVPGKVHAVKMLKGQSYQLDLVSTDFDSYLRLEDSAGNQLAQDDDGGGMLNSRIRFTAAKDDTYLIYATSLGGGAGGYTLSVKSYVVAPVKLVAMPALANKTSQVKAELALNDPLANARAHPCKTFTIDLKAKKTYRIDMSAGFDTYLILEDANGVLIDQNDDNGESLDSRIRFQPAVDGRFRLVATTYNGQVGEFTLRVTEE